MADPIFSPDGKYMWTGNEWIPAPPESDNPSVSLQDSVVAGDINFTQSNDPKAISQGFKIAIKEIAEEEAARNAAEEEAARIAAAKAAAEEAEVARIAAAKAAVEEAEAARKRAEEEEIMRRVEQPILEKIISIQIDSDIPNANVPQTFSELSELLLRGNEFWILKLNETQNEYIQGIFNWIEELQWPVIVEYNIGPYTGEANESNTYTTEAEMMKYIRDKLESSK